MATKVFFAALVLGGVLASGAVAGEINPVVGKVGDFVLREADLERFISYQAPEGQKQMQDDPEKKVALVRQLLTGKAMAEKARKEGFDKKPEVKEQLSYVIDDFLFREFLFKAVTAQVSVPEEELKKFYAEHEKDFAVEAQVKVRHIYFEAKKEVGAEEKAKARAKAEAALQRLKKGEDFAKLALELSEDKGSAVKGGELGYITSGGNLEAFEKAAFALKVGEISDVVATVYGYHLIKLDERREARTASYDEAREYILKRLKGESEQTKAREFVDKVTRDAGMEVFEERITGRKEEPVKKEEAK